MDVTPGAAVWKTLAPDARPLLDAIPQAAAAYGVVRLRRDYPGPAFQVKRASDAKTLDIGFAGDLADWATADAFCSGTSGTFTKWYDQSGNALDAVAGESAPLLTANTTNGFRSITFDTNGGTGPKSFTLPDGLALARTGYSVVDVLYPTGPAWGSNSYLVNGKDPDYTKTALLFSVNTGKVSLLGNVARGFLGLAAMPQVMVLASGAAKLAFTANEQRAAAAALTASPLVGGAIGYYKGYRFYGEQLAMVFYARELGTDETQAAKLWAYRQFRIAPQVVDRLIILGDSIMAGGDSDPALPWSRQMLNLLPHPYKLFNQGASGQTSAFFDNNYEANTAPLFVPGGVRNLLFIAVGSNDLSLAASAADTYSHLSGIIHKAKTTGFGPVGIATILPRQNTPLPGGGAAFEKVRQALNTLITANTAGADFVLDIAADPTIGTLASSLDFALYTGALHLTAKGSAYYAQALAEVLNSR